MKEAKLTNKSQISWDHVQPDPGDKTSWPWSRGHQNPRGHGTVKATNPKFREPEWILARKAIDILELWGELMDGDFPWKPWSRMVWSSWRFFDEPKLKNLTKNVKSWCTLGFSQCGNNGNLLLHILTKFREINFFSNKPNFENSFHEYFSKWDKAKRGNYRNFL